MYCFTVSHHVLQDTAKSTLGLMNYMRYNSTGQFRYNAMFGVHRVHRK